ncbi:MAG TPA: beta-L-arabinofuranosidase domain-containing protein [Bryobacteraceae bacterium]|nr:beta-L-arabinofuranosidase domain-containing protein [Bryobacteraceae bacterium]
MGLLVNRRHVLGCLGLLAATSCERQEQDPSPARPRRRMRDALTLTDLDQVQLGGYLGEKVALVIRNRIFAQSPERLVEPFRHRRERRAWQTEFWGKWALSAAAACRYTHDPGALERLGKSVGQLLATQTGDGYIGNYAPGSHLEGWDIWGRKYTLLALLAWHDLTGDRRALDAARRAAGHLLCETGPCGADIVRRGLYRGMASSSVLEPMVLLYRRTNDERYLRFAEYIVSRWSSRKGPRLVESALAGIPAGRRFPRPEKWFTWENGEKAYEMMSCYAGLVELYRETGREKWLQAALRTCESIRETEINIAGGGSSQECWYGGAARQTEPAPDAMETCVSVSWIQLCTHLLRATGDSRFADEIEKTAYNALLGAMTPDGSAFGKYSTLAGTRELGPPQCGMELNCCTASGPRGIMLLPQVAVMRGARGPVINLYSEGTWSVKLPSGRFCRLGMKTDYPVSGRVDLTVEPEQAESFALRLRVPAWSGAATIAVAGGKVRDAQPGAYAAIERRWKPGDSIRLELDVRGRVVHAANGTRQYAAVVRGPVVLARDLRLSQAGVDEAAGGIGDGPIDLRPAAPPTGVRLAFTAGPAGVPLCDYASAGNTWDGRSRFRVWMPVS